VLSIDGGGIRGIIPALVLAEIEERTGRRVAELFDLIAGTSTGGILACALGAPGARPAAELVDLYRARGPEIFRDSLWQRAVSGAGLLNEKHDHAALDGVLSGYLKDAWLSEATTRLLVTSYDLEAREPYFFKSWRPERDAPLTAVARATSAAPTYFEPLALDGRSLVDGGVFANNPAMCAYAEAERLAPADAHLIVSLGTGQLTKRIHHEDAKGWGLIEWVRPLIDVVFDGVQDTVDYQLRHLCLDGDYARFQVELRDGASDALDDAGPGNLRRLEERARELLATRDADLDSVCARLVATAPRAPGLATP
jgi:patatin-like phospholipase/acyl hydrolase